MEKEKKLFLLLFLFVLSAAAINAFPTNIFENGIQNYYFIGDNMMVGDISIVNGATFKLFIKNNNTYNLTGIIASVTTSEGCILPSTASTNVRYNLSATLFSSASVSCSGISSRTLEGNITLNYEINHTGITKTTYGFFKINSELSDIDLAFNYSSVYYSLITLKIGNNPPNATNVSITPILANKTTDLKGHLNFSDADGNNAGGNQTLWYKNGILITTANNQINFSKSNFTITSNDTIIFSARFNDTYEWGSWVNSSAITVKENALPSVSSATINNTSPLNTDDLQCNNGTTSDADSDVISLLYNWTKGGVDQVISTKTLDNSLTSVNDNWLCKITPFDGYENGTTILSATVSIGTGYIPPIINFTNSTPLTAELLKGEWLNLSVNFTDENTEDKHTAYFCKDLGCSQTWCVSPINITGNYTSCRLNITNSSDFSLQSYTFYTFVVDNTTLTSSSISNTFTIQDITPPTLNNWSLQYTNLNDASGNTNQFNVSVTDNVSNIQTITFDINGTLNVSRSFTITPALSVSLSYKLFETSETLLKGTYNITKVTVTDNKSNSQIYNYNNITFTVSAQPSSGGITGGGGGIESVIIINKTTIISEILCNFNGICEIETGEDFVNCGNQKSPFDRGGDCGFELGLLGSTIRNQLKFGLVSKVLFGLFIISIGVLAFLPKERIEKIKRNIKVARLQRD